MRAKRTAYLCDDEPQLQEMLEDPVIQAVMARDGVARAQLVDLVHSVQARLGPAMPKHGYSASCCTA
jgi:hypothetical protein